jgi:hypothetical protein
VLVDFFLFKVLFFVCAQRGLAGGHFKRGTAFASLVKSE